MFGGSEGGLPRGLWRPDLRTDTVFVGVIIIAVSGMLLTFLTLNASNAAFLVAAGRWGGVFVRYEPLRRAQNGSF